MTNRLDTNFYPREDIVTNITPKVFVQPRVDTPAGEWKPAAWLPVQYTRSDIHQGEDAYVIGVGKVVAFDSQGKLVPAGLRAKFAKTAATTILTYTALDAKWGVQDLVTGQKYTTNGTTSYTAQQVALALLSRGLVDGAAVITSYGTVDFSDPAPLTTNQLAEVFQAFISPAVGVSAYEFHVWSGRPEDGDQHFTNFSKQHLVQFLTMTQMRVPSRAGATNSQAFNTGTIVVATAAYDAGEVPASGTVSNAAAISSLARYSNLAGKPLVAAKLAHFDVAANTDRTPFTSNVAGVLVREVGSAAAISRAGDFFIDLEMGILFLSSVTYATLVAGPTIVTFGYTHYGSTGATSQRFVYQDGRLNFGDGLSYDENSNFVKVGTSADALGASNTKIIARYLADEVYPRQHLQHVKTAWTQPEFSNASKMPGSATKGFADNITLADEPVADRLAILNLFVVS